MAISEFGKYEPSKALGRALGSLDEPSRHAVVYHLKQRYQIDLLSEPTLAEIEDAISDMFGEGAAILLARFYMELHHDVTA